MNTEKIILFDIDYTLFRTDIFKASDLTDYTLYDEVEAVLKELGKTAMLGIFSEGEFALQTEKLLQTKIKEYFFDDSIHIVSSKAETIATVLQKYKNKKLFLVDDKLQVLYTAKFILPSIKVIWIKRGYYAERQKPIAGFTPDATVETLREIITYIKKN